MGNILVNNLCNWPLYFKRITSIGSVAVPPRARNYPLISFDEALAQIQSGNRMFVGTDGTGGHARIQIIDDAIRGQLFGIPSDAVSKTILTQESVKSLLSIKSKQKFKESLSNLVRTSAEKKMLMTLVSDVGGENAESWKVDMLREISEEIL